MATDVITGSAAVHLPDRLSLPALREAVFGEGAASAEVILVGEQPGNAEDREGRPFVEPAGRLLDRAPEEAEIDRAATYVTNVVKHFTWQGRGKRRIHQKPNWTEIAACRPWLDAELAVVTPRVLVCLGATAARPCWAGSSASAKAAASWWTHR